MNFGTKILAEKIEQIGYQVEFHNTKNTKEIDFIDSPHNRMVEQIRQDPDQKTSELVWYQTLIQELFTNALTELITKTGDSIETTTLATLTKQAIEKHMQSMKQIRSFEKRIKKALGQSKTYQDVIASL